MLDIYSQVRVALPRHVRTRRHPRADRREKKEKKENPPPPPLLERYWRGSVPQNEEKQIATLAAQPQNEKDILKKEMACEILNENKFVSTLDDALPLSSLQRGF